MKLIVEMEMPKDCPMCPMAHYNKLDEFTGCEVAAGKLFAATRDKEYANSVGRPDWCPIKGELPDEHGRLIDADAMAKDLEYDCELDARGLDDMTIVGHEREHLQFDKDCKQNCMWYLTEQETIVPATHDYDFFYADAERKDDGTTAD